LVWPPVDTLGDTNRFWATIIDIFICVRICGIVSGWIPARECSFGSYCVVACTPLCDFASYVMHGMRSAPVDRISGPSSMSAPGNLENGSTTSFTDTWSTCTHHGTYYVNNTTYYVIP
jgi:hypothetical protein